MFLRGTALNPGRLVRLVADIFRHKGKFIACICDAIAIFIKLAFFSQLIKLKWNDLPFVCNSLISKCRPFIDNETEQRRFVGLEHGGNVSARQAVILRR